MRCAIVAGMLCLVVTGCGHHRTEQAPPPPDRVEVTGTAPSGDYVWIAGHWDWRDHDWAWIPGHWMQRSYRGAEWVPGHWVHVHHGWVWHEGHWR